MGTGAGDVGHVDAAVDGLDGIGAAGAIDLDAAVDGADFEFRIAGDGDGDFVFDAGFAAVPVAAGFAVTPAAAAKAKNYDAWNKSFATWLPTLPKP